MIARAHTADHVRRKIEALGTSMSLPTVAKALGVLEGEPRSNRRGGNDDLLDIRPALGTSMSLPTVAKALGVLEGEPRSNRRGGNDDLLDIRPY